MGAYSMDRHDQHVIVCKVDARGKEEIKVEKDGKRENAEINLFRSNAAIMMTSRFDIRIRKLRMYNLIVQITRD